MEVGIYMVFIYMISDFGVFRVGNLKGARGEYV